MRGCLLVAELVHICDAIAPAALAEEWDNVGLQVGDPAAEVRGILCCLEATEAVVAEAQTRGAQCLVTHHPLLFWPLRSLREDWPESRLAAELVRSRMALYAMHTNLDLNRPGTSDALADALGVVGACPLVPLERDPGEPRLKLVVFVPASEAWRVREALGDAGAGVIGRYSHCSFSSPGVGSFRPMEGARPAVGAVGNQEQVAEERVEVVVPRSALPRVLEAMFAVHPYEEVAYDLYPLAPPPTGAGLGRVGTLANPCALGELAGRVGAALGAAHVVIAGDRSRRCQRVALCGGSGGDLVDAAASSGADVLVTGDVKHHQARRALDLGLAILDPGHHASERPVVDLLARLLRERVPAGVAVHVSDVNTDPFA